MIKTEGRCELIYVLIAYNTNVEVVLMSKNCIKCGTPKVYCKELCHKCYMQQYRHDNKKRLIILAKQRRKNNRDTRKKSDAIRRRQNGGLSMSENKDCSMFLGVHVAERVLSYIFNDVDIMPIGNPGYDFICNKGKKIDVKSSCLRNTAKTPFWSFHIEYNKIADHFLCLAFDNRDNLNPIHIWLLPGNKFNHLSAAVISKNTIKKWAPYNIPVEKVENCCNVLRK